MEGRPAVAATKNGPKRQAAEAGRDGAKQPATMTTRTKREEGPGLGGFFLFLVSAAKRAGGCTPGQSKRLAIYYIHARVA